MPPPVFGANGAIRVRVAPPGILRLLPDQAVGRICLRNALTRPGGPPLEQTRKSPIRGHSGPVTRVHCPVAHSVPRTWPESSGETRSVAVGEASAEAQVARAPATAAGAPV
jgi:hypothetical protein